MCVYLHGFSEYPWGTQFVAVTQEINTATSAGRMMLNILITFAQYEREVITERVRDKMAASRKKGKWVGGSVPMGYRVENKKLVVEPEEARVIQRIFQRFIEIQSPTLIAQELNKDGIRTKQGKAWDKPHIYRILSNHTYIGQVKYKGSICEGEQNAIVELDVWNRTREILALNEPVPRQTKRMETIAPLKGIGYFRIFSPGQPAVLLSERQESFDSVCCRHAGSGVTIPCFRTSDKASCLWQ